MCLHLSLAMAGDSLGITGTNGQALLAESAYGKLIVDAVIVGKHYFHTTRTGWIKQVLLCEKDWLSRNILQ